MTTTRPGGASFFFPWKCNWAFTWSHQPYSQSDSRVFSSGAGDSLYTVWAPKNHVSIQLHSCRTMNDVSRPFSGMSIKGHMHSQNKKEWQENILCSQTLASDSLWPPTQFVLLQAKFCHDGDLKCAPSAPFTSCNGQWDFDLRAVIGFHLGTVSLFYSPVTRMYSLRTWLLIAHAGMAGQRRRYPLETPALFWHRLSVRNGLRSQALSWKVLHGDSKG